MTEAKTKMGRPAIADRPLPPKVKRALELYATNHSWTQCAEQVGMDHRSLRRYLTCHPAAAGYLADSESIAADRLQESYAVLMDAAPVAAKRMVDLINDPKTPKYVLVNAIESYYRIIDRGVTDRENRQALTAIRETLNALEGGKVVDVGRS